MLLQLDELRLELPPPRLQRALLALPLVLVLPDVVHADVGGERSEDLLLLPQDARLELGHARRRGRRRRLQLLQPRSQRLELSVDLGQVCSRGGGAVGCGLALRLGVRRAALEPLHARAQRLHPLLCSARSAAAVTAPHLLVQSLALLLERRAAAA